MTIMSQPSPHERRGELEEQFVGYLDGELDAPNAHRVEEALAADPHVREEVWKLEQTWEMLDELPRTQVDESFTRSTVEMIAVRAEQELAQAAQLIPQRRRNAWLLSGTVVACAAIAGFLSVLVMEQRADERLLRDLPVIENFEQYREVGDIEFLRLLRERGFAQAEVKHGN